MGLKPAYKIEVDGVDLSRKLQGNLLELLVVDDAEYSADTLTFSFFGANIAFPTTGKLVSVSLGYDLALTPFGKYTIDEIEYDVVRSVFTVRGKSADMGSGLKQKRGRSFRPEKHGAVTTFGDVVRVIAQENGLIPSLPPGMADAILGDFVQSNESDMHFLTRMAKEVFDATVKVYGDKLIVVHRDEGVSVSGKALGIIPFARDRFETGVVTLKEREAYKSVAVVWFDRKTRKEIRISYPDRSEPQFVLARRFTNEASAKAVARIQFASLQRKTMEMRLSTVGEPGLRAERVLEVSGVKEGLDGKWLINRAEHRLSTAGYRTSLTCEKSFQ